MYDPNELIRDKAIQVLTDLRHVVQQKENDYILNLTLKLAHDDLEMNRVSSLKIMNELAPDMGQTLCEFFICPEIRSLALDEKPGVRHAVTKNFIKTTGLISQGYFCQYIFPMYQKLSVDLDEKVRKGCAETISEISKISPLDKYGETLQQMYFKFLKDQNSKIVRGTAYQHIGSFIANFKDVM